MRGSRERQYFIVKHGLDSLEQKPFWIWNTEKGRNDIPRGYRQVQKGDWWIGFAYTTSDAQERPLGLITRFCECTETADYQNVTRETAPIYRGNAWVIRGKPAAGWQPKEPVVVPPLADKEMLRCRPFSRNTITRIEKEEFERIRKTTCKYELPRKKIPLLNRAPQNEQELLALVIAAHKRLGIERIERVQKAFPDLLVKLAGHREAVYLELELSSQGFDAHGHAKQCPKGWFSGHNGTCAGPVAVLCWMKDGKAKAVERRVHRVYELRELLRSSGKILW